MIARMHSFNKNGEYCEGIWPSNLIKKEIHMERIIKIISMQTKNIILVIGVFLNGLNVIYNFF